MGFNRGTIDLVVAIMDGSLATHLNLVNEFRVVWWIYYGKLPKKLEDVKTEPMEMALPLLALGALAVIFGIWPALIPNLIEVFIEHLFHN